MPGSYVKIQSTTVGATAVASIEFTDIPGTFDDLLIKVSSRSDDSASTSGSYYIIFFNNSSTSFSNRYLRGSGSAVAVNQFAQYAGNSSTTGQTTQTFSNDEIYITNYAGSNSKAYSADSVVENNATGAFQTFNTGIWANSNAITSVKLEAANAGANKYIQYSTFTLYGIKKS